MPVYHIAFMTVIPSGTSYFLAGDLDRDHPRLHHLGLIDHIFGVSCAIALNW